MILGSKNLIEMKIIKFGGTSLANGKGLDRCLKIVEEKLKNGEEISVVVSARGNTTDSLIDLLHAAKTNHEFEGKWANFQAYQQEPKPGIDFTQEFSELRQLLHGIELLNEYSPKIEARILSFGEIFSAQLFAQLLADRGLKSQFVDSRDFLITDSDYLNALPLEDTSTDLAKQLFQPLFSEKITPVVTGFIASDMRRETTTLGRNGSNYTASLLAKFLDAEKVENYTNVDGVYTADPNLVPRARLLKHISYAEVNELVNFGANILHAKTLLPLVEKNIPIEIKNTFADFDQRGTLISKNGTEGQVKTLSVLKNKALIIVEGRGLLGKVGVDSRIFSTMAKANISVGIISQGSSERGIGFVVDEKDSDKAVDALRQEFKYDFHSKDMQRIVAEKGYSVLSMVGLDIDQFALPFQSLIQNQMKPKVINTTVTGKNVSILIQQEDIHKALSIIHAELFEDAKPVYLALFGHGNVGGTLIRQILKSAKEIQRRKHIRLVILAIANSKKMIINKDGLNEEWQAELQKSQLPSSPQLLFEYVKANHIGNLILVDNTASDEFVHHYEEFVNEGFDIVSSNKVHNCLPISDYQSLREALKENKKLYLYETNVGAGLPLIDTIKLLHLSGENITRIRGIFSGSLSYIFNHFSKRDVSFSTIVKEAIEKGYAEPDPRIDLSGMDVARKLLILARELDLVNNIEDVSVENLIPKELQHIQVDELMNKLDTLDTIFAERKSSLKEGYLFRYIGDLHGDLSKEKGELTVELVEVDELSSLGQLKGADSIFEIYTESYGEQPLIVQGSGAGAAVTARGVFGDILRLAN